MAKEVNYSNTNSYPEIKFRVGNNIREALGNLKEGSLYFDIEARIIYLAIKTKDNDLDLIPFDTAFFDQSGNNIEETYIKKSDRLGYPDKAGDYFLNIDSDNNPNWQEIEYYIMDDTTVEETGE